MATRATAKTVTKKRVDLDFAEQCIIDPVFFAEHVLGFDAWGMQKKILQSIADNKRTLVKACHSSGKTEIAAVSGIWFLVTHDPVLCYSTAPVARQVSSLLWRAWATRVQRAKMPIPGRIFRVPRHEISRSQLAFGFTATNSDAAQGLHSPNIMSILDEASGIPVPIWEADAANLSSGFARNLAIGNPLDPISEFFEQCSLPNANVLTISAYTTPNFTELGITEEHILDGSWQEMVTDPLPRPYLVTPQYAADVISRYGQHSSTYYARVLGEFPQDSEDTLIPLAAIERAEQRWLEYQETPEDAAIKPEGRIEIGVDVADSGKDFSVRVIRQGKYVHAIRISPFSDNAVDTAGRVIGDLREFGDRNPIARIDNIGVGAPTASLVAQEGFNVARINGQGKPAHARHGTTECLNARAEAYWLLRDAFVAGTIAIPEDGYLRQELTSLRYKLTAAGKVQIIAKDDIKKAIGRSPDRADALAYSYSPVGSHGMADPDAPLWEEPDMPTTGAQIEYTHENLLSLIGGRAW